MDGMSPRSRSRKTKPRRSTTARPAPASATVSSVVSAAVTAKPVAATNAPATEISQGQARLVLTTVNCDPLHQIEPRGLGMTYCFDTSRWPYAARVTVRFDGRQLSAAEEGAPGMFTVTDAVDVPPRVGRVTVTSHAANVAAGLWRVTASASVENADVPTGSGKLWRLPSMSAEGVPVFEPVTRVRAPGARLGVWPALVLTGALLAFASQLLVAPRLHVAAWPLVAVSVLASLVGLVASKLYYKVLHPKESGGLVVTGLGIQGFVLGALLTLAVGAAVVGFPLLRGLDAITPGLLLAMTIGRFGCFFGGCCAGRPTAGRGLWSSDRHVGIRRIPVQLFESGVAAVVAVGAIAADLTRAAPAGVVFVGALAAYVLGRQLLFPLREIARQTRHGRGLVIALCATTLLFDIVVGVAVG